MSTGEERGERREEEEEEEGERRSGNLSIGEDGPVVALHRLRCHWLHNLMKDLFVGVLRTEEVVEEVADWGRVGLHLVNSCA